MCRRKVASERKVACAIRSQVNVMVCSLKVLHEGLFVSVLLVVWQ